VVRKNVIDASVDRRALPSSGAVGRETASGGGATHRIFRTSSVVCAVAILALVPVAFASAARDASRYAGTGPDYPASSFPCQWHWNLQDGLRPGYVTAGINGDCGGRNGSLTLSIRLLSKQRNAKQWHTDTFKSQTWSSLNGPDRLGVQARCAAETIRGTFGWTLRDQRGAVVSRKVLRSAPLVVPGPSCRLILGHS